MISSSFAYDQLVKYSYEIPNEYLSGPMVIFILAYVAIYSDSFIFGKATSSHFFRIAFFKVSQELLFLSSFSSEQLPFQRSSFFRTVTFSQHISQNSYFFRVKLLSRNHTLRIGNSLVQLPFGTPSHRRHLHKSYFFEADSSAQHQLFFKKKRFWKKLLFQKSNIPHNLLFLESYLFNVFIINRYLLQQLHFRNTTFLQHTQRNTISQVPFFCTVTLPINQSLTE